MIEGSSMVWAAPYPKSLRQFFAGMALQGMLANERGHLATPEQHAERAVQCADALIAELDKTEQEDGNHG